MSISVISSNLLRVLSSLVPCSLNLHKRHYLRRFLPFFSAAILLCVLFTAFNHQENDQGPDIQSPPTHLFEPNTSISIPLAQNNSRSYHVVLLWTDLFHELYWHQPAFFNSSVVVACSPTHLCQFTRDRRRLSQSATVAFHLYDTDRNGLPERDPSQTNNQTWVFVTGESPVNFYYQNPSFFPRILDDYFDRSISYKDNSSYAVFAPVIQPRPTSDRMAELQLNNRSLEYKKKPVVWIVSNCDTFSQREKYVEELKKFIQVDIYGKCGTACSQKANRSCDVDLREYYFYLSFENSRCNSYITEKFWNVISNADHRLVPIVMGAPERDYRRIAPKDSYIHVDRYKNPQDLAQHLAGLIITPEKYLAHLQWRVEYDIVRPRSPRWMNLLCPLCHMAYEPQQSPPSRIRFSTWYEPKTECHSDDVRVLTQCKQVNLKGWLGLTNNVKCP